MQRSEIAQLRQRIEFEYQAGKWALHGLAAGMAQHQFITARFRQMEQCHKRLTKLVGEEQATDYLCEVFNQTETEEPETSGAEDVPLHMGEEIRSETDTSGLGEPATLQ